MAVGVGIVGAGVVGGGAIQILQDNHQSIKTGTGLDIGLVSVCDVNADNFDAFNLEGVTLTDDAAALNADPNVHIVCELIGGIEPAKTIVLNALKAGKSVVTANKMLIAYHGAELARAAAHNNVELKFEAAVAGGIPIIKALREGLAANRIASLYGILNGTCNYILTQMTYAGIGFEEALKKAQELGFAETPPDLDIEGHDTAHKCQILASLCFRTEIDIDDIAVEGITTITGSDVAYADEMGYIIKLLAIARDVEGGIDARVHPTLVPKRHLLASVQNEFNAIYVMSDKADATLYYGKGAGRLPTASAVIADVIDIARRGDSPPSPVFAFGEKRTLRDIGDLRGRYYLRLTTKDESGVLGRVCTALGDEQVGIASCIQKDPHGEHAVHVVMMTHETVESSLTKALGKIDRMDFVTEPTHMIRMLQE